VRVAAAGSRVMAGELAADPQAAIRRRRKAEKDARVQAWLETAGTGALAGRGLPAAEMIAADQCIDAQSGG